MFSLELWSSVLREIFFGNLGWNWVAAEHQPVRSTVSGRAVIEHVGGSVAADGVHNGSPEFHRKLRALLRAFESQLGTDGKCREPFALCRGLAAGPSQLRLRESQHAQQIGRAEGILGLRQR